MPGYWGRKRLTEIFDRVRGQMTSCPKCNKPVTLSYLDENKQSLIFKHKKLVKSKHRPRGHGIHETTYCEITQDEQREGSVKDGSKKTDNGV